MTELAMVPQSDPALVAFLADTVRPGEEPAEPFVILSDEEILAIDRDIDPEHTLAPWALDQPDMDISMFTRVGERSLVLRGLVDLTLDPDDPADPVRSSTQGLLDLAISARRSGAAMIRMTATLAEYRVGLVVAVQPEHGVVVEDVRAEGFHVFTALDYQQAIAEMAQWCVPPDATSTGTGSLTLRDDQWASWAANELGTGAHVVDVDLYLPTDDGQVLDEHWVVASGDGTAVLVTRRDETHLDVVTTSRPALAELLGERMTRAVGTVTG